MRINISYSIEVEELPKLIEKLINDSVLPMEEALSIVKSDIGDFAEGEYEKIILSIDKTRRNLALSDLKLRESYSIMVDYLNMLQQEKEVSLPAKTGQIDKELQNLRQELEKSKVDIQRHVQQLNSGGH